MGIVIQISGALLVLADLYFDSDLEMLTEGAKRVEHSPLHASR
ncbi:hypothetical protein [Cryobacterium adonitolivorans]|nr:hypothetical protein [Cryobacterium adonitolivorans]